MNLVSETEENYKLNQLKGDTFAVDNSIRYILSELLLQQQRNKHIAPVLTLHTSETIQFLKFLIDWRQTQHT